MSRKRIKRKDSILLVNDKIKESLDRLYREAQLEAFKQHCNKLKFNLPNFSREEIIDGFFNLWLIRGDKESMLVKETILEMKEDSISLEDLRMGVLDILEEAFENIEKEKKEIFLAEGRHQSGRWHIAFQKPLSSFDLTDEEQFKEAVHYTNLCPRWSEDIEN